MALYNTTTKSEFDNKVLKSKKLVLVDFWAVWCGPCRAMAPLLHELADKHDADIDVVKVNIEESQDNQLLAGEYQVRSIPNMNLFKDGELVEQIIGTVPLSTLEAAIAKHSS